MDFNTLGLIFADGRMLTAPEAAAYIKSLQEEIKWLREDNRELSLRLNGEVFNEYVKEAVTSGLQSENKKI